MWTQKVGGGGVDALAYSPDGRTLYTADRSGWVTAWDVASRSSTPVFQPVRLVFASVRGLAVAGGGQYILARSDEWIAWDSKGSTEAARFRPSRLDYGLRFESATTAAVRVGPGTVRRWDFLTNEYTADLGTWRVPGPVRFAELAPDLRRIAVVTVKGEVHFAELIGGQPAYKIDLADPVYNGLGVAFSPDGDTLAILYHRLMYLWDVPARKVRAKTLWSDPNDNWKLSFHPTAPAFVALNRDKVLTLFSRTTGDPIRSLDFALGKAVRCAAFAPDGLTCAVGGSNRQFAVFDVDV
jgi:WD40 repeat protein